MFNKYHWVEDVKDELLELAKAGHSEDELDEAINHSIEFAVIYYRDCWEIAEAFHMTEWSKLDYPVTGITQLAAYALREYSIEAIDLTQILKDAENV
jgi:hypothetical protein